MTGSSTGNPAAAAPAREASPRFPLSPRQIAFGAIVVVVLIAAVAWIVQYRAGHARRQYDKLMIGTLDRLLTAQEGFFYDSSHYVGSLRALPTVHLTPGVHLEMANPDRRSWWGVATHTGLTGHRCVVWVGTAPASFPADVRAPENEAKPICFDDTPSGTSHSNRS
jgi:hypothetical protein